MLKTFEHLPYATLRQNLSSGYLTRFDTNWPVQIQKMARGLKFRKKRDCTIYVAKTMALISCSITAQLICAFVFAYNMKSSFFHEVAHFLLNGCIYESIRLIEVCFQEMYEPRCVTRKPTFKGFRPGPTQTRTVQPQRIARGLRFLFKK